MRIMLVLIFVLALAWIGGEGRPAQTDDEIILRMSFHVSDRSVSNLMILLKEYAAENGYSFQNVGENMPHRYIPKPFFVNLYRNNTQIIVTDMAAKGQMLLVISGAKADSTKPGVFTPLLNKIRGKWPDLHAYSDP